MNVLIRDKWFLFPGFNQASTNEVCMAVFSAATGGNISDVLSAGRVESSARHQHVDRMSYVDECWQLHGTVLFLQHAPLQRRHQSTEHRTQMGRCRSPRRGCYYPHVLCPGRPRVNSTYFDLLWIWCTACCTTKSTKVEGLQQIHKLFIRPVVHNKWK